MVPVAAATRAAAALREAVMPRHRFASIRSLAFGSALTAVAPSVHAQICTPFTDVAAADGFCSSIQWMHNRGITLGCTASQYCPADPVRRDQMAAFMFRLGNVVHQQGGNAFGATAVLGTTDDHPLDIRVNDARVMRYEPNAISPNVIGGSPVNGVAAGVRGATIAGGGMPQGGDPIWGGGPNRVTAHYGAVAGGLDNAASGIASAIGGGIQNLAGATGSTVGGGFFHIASGGNATVGGGRANDATGDYSVVSGGHFNNASGTESVVSGGNANVASGFRSAVVGGSGNVASGDYAIAMGRDNLAQGDYSVALGRRAKNLNQGSFQFADSQPFDYTTSGINNFRVRATGGVRFTTGIDATGATTWSCETTNGNGWSCASDRNLKQNVVALDGEAVLAKLIALPVYQWQPKGGHAPVKHYGPMAQDFHAAFGLGHDDRMIGFQDADGVALAAIQGLNAKLEARVAEQSREIAALRERLDALLARLTLPDRAQR